MGHNAHLRNSISSLSKAIIIPANTVAISLAEIDPVVQEKKIFKVMVIVFSCDPLFEETLIPSPTNVFIVPSFEIDPMVLENKKNCDNDR